MKKIIQLILATLVAATVSGCASTGGYWTDRGRDAADVFTVTGGLGLGAKARIGPVGTGLLAQTDMIGLRDGYFFTSSPSEKSMYYDVLLIYRAEDNAHNYSNDRKDNLKRKMNFPFIYEDLPACQWYQIEAVIALGPSVRLGFNPGELVDFLLGFATIDIFDDDLAAKARQESAEKNRQDARVAREAKNEPPRESLSHPVIESQQPRTQ